MGVAHDERGCDSIFLVMKVERLVSEGGNENNICIVMEIAISLTS